MTYNTNEQMIIKSFIYGFEIVFLQFTLPIMFCLKFPKDTSAGGYSVEALYIYLVAIEWKRQLHGLDFKNSHEYTTVTCLQ